MNCWLSKTRAHGVEQLAPQWSMLTREIEERNVHQISFSMRHSPAVPDGIGSRRDATVSVLANALEHEHVREEPPGRPQERAAHRHCRVFADDEPFQN